MIAENKDNIMENKDNIMEKKDNIFIYLFLTLLSNTKQ